MSQISFQLNIFLFSVILLNAALLNDNTQNDIMVIVFMHCVILMNGIQQSLILQSGIMLNVFLFSVILLNVALLLWQKSEWYYAHCFHALRHSDIPFCLVSFFQMLCHCHASDINCVKYYFTQCHSAESQNSNKSLKHDIGRFESILSFSLFELKPLKFSCLNSELF